MFLTEIDLFLIGATLIIAAIGLYELFIARIDPANLHRPLPAWLEMNDLNDLKARVIAMIILVCAVTFTDVLLEFAKDDAGRAVPGRGGRDIHRRAHRLPQVRLRQRW